MSTLRWCAMFDRFIAEDLRWDGYLALPDVTEGKEEEEGKRSASRGHQDHDSISRASAEPGRFTARSPRHDQPKPRVHANGAQSLGAMGASPPGYMVTVRTTRVMRAAVSIVSIRIPAPDAAATISGSVRKKMRRRVTSSSRR